MVDDDECGASCSDRIVFQVVLPWLSPILFYQCGCLSLYSRRVVSRPRQMRTHVDPPYPLKKLSFFLSFTRCLGDSVFACIHPCLTHQGSHDHRSDSFSTFCVVWFLSLFRAMRALHNRDNLQCSEPPCLQTTRGNLSAQPKGILQTAILGKWDPAPSGPTFATECHTLCHGFLHLYLVRFGSLVFQSLPIPIFVHDLRCKTEKPAEQRTVIYDPHAGVLINGNQICSALSVHSSYSHFHTTVGHVTTSSEPCGMTSTKAQARTTAY